MLKSLNSFKRLRRSVVESKKAYFRTIWGMDIHPTVQLSLRADLDKTYPRGVHIDEYTYVAFCATILTHDRTRGLHVDTYIGKNCFIGAHSIVLPGLTIGDNSVIGAGAVVTKDVPPRSIVAGNPAKIIRSDIEVGHYGRFKSVDVRSATEEVDLAEQ